MTLPSTRPARPLTGEMTVPGDKSVSHRSLMFSALSSGTSRINGLLHSADVRATAGCLQALGVEIEEQNGQTLVHGYGTGWKEPTRVLNADNSGTTIRLMSGLLTPQPFYCVITGDESLGKRPMGRVIEPLTQMGGTLYGRDNNRYAPLTILAPERQLKGINYTLPVASAQLKSALLLAGLFADGQTVLIEPAPSRDHTERMLRHLGVDVQADGSRLILNPKPFQPFEASEWVVPGDFSSAAFFIVAGLLIQGSQLVIRNVGLNPYRTGLMTVLQSVGGKITIENERLVGGEPIGDLVVTGSEMVGDIELSEDDIPGLIDEVPILTIAGLYLNGTLTVRGAEELRKKESDRIEAMAVELRKLGIDMETYPDGFRLQGNPDRTIAAPSQPLYAHHDHRIAMAFGILNRIADPEAVWTMDGREWVSISFPTFFDCLTQLSR